ncbi:MAG: hypothetical protein HYZ44_02405 [Bacteroidetes bacterium]|nr:hypothetical protein [Bacteroidota bacterium]
MLPVLAGVLGGDFVYNGGLESLTQAVSAFNTAIPLMIQPPTNGNDRPHAYINYLIFPADNSTPYGVSTQIPASAGFEEPQRNAPFTTNNLVKVDPFTITKAGYVYIWVSNETENTEVCFDDVSVLNYNGVVTQATEYGAWGEVMREQRLDLASGEQTTPLLKDNIQANYKLDGNALDAGPNAMNGTVTGATPTTDKNNQAGTAYSFNGTSRIDLPGTAQKLSFIQNTGVFSLSVFMKVNNVDANSYMLGSVNTSVSKGFTLTFGNLGSPRQVGFSIFRGVSGSSVYPKSATNSINDTNWHHVAVVGDGTTVKMYVDGVQSGAAVTFTGTTGDSSFDLLLGGTRTSTGAFSNGFSGGLDGLLVFDRTLTDEEVAALATGKPTEDIDAETLSQKYRYGYQGKYAERDEETGWNHFELREYDPVIGRWLQYDPKGQFYSPYVGMGNDPINGVDPDGGSKVSAWIGKNLPGLIAAPLAGMVDFAEGIGIGIGGLFSLNGNMIGKGFGGAGLGLLRSFGLKEALTEKWVSGTTGGFLPKSLKDELDDAGNMAPGDAGKNGMHAWHAGTNAALTHRLGPVGAIFVFVGGLFHESPLDWGSFKAEQNFQGTINHILDSSTDIIANAFGMGMGFLLPKKVALNVSVKLGNQIPGPGDPDPAFGGNGKYKMWHPWKAWGQYPKF